MRVAVRGAVAIGALAAVLAAALPGSASAATRPGSVSNVSAVAGAKAGQIKVSWRASGAHTDKFYVETALTPFGSTNNGRGAHTFSVKGSARSVTLSAASVSAAGAAPETGNHLYVRVVAVDVLSHGVRRGTASGLVATTARATDVPEGGSTLRIASYNIRSAMYDGQGGRKWIARAPGVAQDILDANPGIVAIQEASPGRYAGVRQTESLQAALVAADPVVKRYTITRTSGYSAPGSTHGSQAARILYDNTRYTLLTPCTDTTMLNGAALAYSSSCSFDLPVRPGDAASWVRSAAWAELMDKTTGKRFLVVSAHLDYRHSSKASEEASLNDLRTRQAAVIVANMNLLRSSPDEPVVVAGDFNADQADAGGNGPHDYLVASGYRDAAGATKQQNLQYPSLNHFDKTLKADPQGYGRRVDQILVSGALASKKFKQVVEQTNAKRNSDHNMVYADVVLPGF